MDLDVLAPNDDALYATQSASYTGTAGNTSAFNPGPRSVFVWTTTDAYVKVGEGVTATSASLLVPAYTPVVIKVPTGIGATWRVSAIQLSTAGTVYAKPLN